MDIDRVLEELESTLGAAEPSVIVDEALEPPMELEATSPFIQPLNHRSPWAATETTVPVDMPWIRAQLW